MTEIIDLDRILGKPDKRVKLGGQEYRLPHDLPVELFLAVNQAARNGGNDIEVVTALSELLLELFQMKNPKVQKLPLGVTQLLDVIPAIYGNGQASDPEGGERPTTPKTRGETSRPRTSSARARSRSAS